MSTMEQEQKEDVPITTIADSAKKFIQVKLQKAPDEGFGFNLVGGTDKQHLAGHSEIFISRIRPQTPAARESQLELGDIIVSINGVDLSAVTHDEAIELFRTASDVCDIVVEKGGERRILSEPLGFPDNLPASAKVNEMAMNFFLDESESSKIDKTNYSTHKDLTNCLSDDEKFFTPMTSPGSMTFNTRHQLLRSNQGSAGGQDSSTSSFRLECGKQEKNFRQLSFLSDEEEETASVTLPYQVLQERVNDSWRSEGQAESEKEASEDSKEFDQRSSATSSISSNSVHSPSPVLKKAPLFDYLKGAFLANGIFCVSVGTAALGATAFFVYRWYKKN